jgi:hypothetical protein
LLLLALDAIALSTQLVIGFQAVMLLSLSLFTE